MSYGWVSIHRQLQDHWLWEDKPFSKGQAWVDMLLMANHADKKFMLGNELVEVKAGSFITSEYKLMERWGWSKTKVRSFLDILQKDEMIVKNSDRKKTTITLVNYGLFQDSETTERPQKDRKKTTKKPQKNPNNNDNNVNNENNIIYYADDPNLNQAIIEFVDFRKGIKKPMSEHAVKLMIGKLNKMTSDVNTQIEIINQSILNGWQGIFPLKEDKQPKQQQSNKNKFNNFPQRTYDMEAYERMLLNKENPPPTAGENAEIQAKVDELKKKLGVV